MIVLQKQGPKGRKRKHVRLEELEKFSIQDLVTNKPGAKHSFWDADKGRMEWVDEYVGGQQLLTLYWQGRRTVHSYLIVDRSNPGCRLKNQKRPHQQLYYVVIDGRRYRHIYVDTINKKIGSRHTFQAYYTSESVGPKQKIFWREYQKLKKKAARYNSNNRGALP
jgi:hypothetical protein